MKWKGLFVLVSILVLFAVPTGSALAAPSSFLDRILTGEDYHLEAGETERGDVVVFGGSAQIEKHAVLDGNLAVFGGGVEIAGTVKGDVVALVGDVDVREGAHVEGDCVAIGGVLDIEEGGSVDGDVVTSGEAAWLPFSKWIGRYGFPPTPVPPTKPRTVYRYGGRSAGRVGGAFLSAIIIGVAAMLITLFWPRQADQVRRVILRQPAASGVVGLLTVLAAGLLTPVLFLLSALLLLICIGLLGFPLIALLWLVFAAACLLGWAAVGQVVGRWVGDRLALQRMTPVLEAGLGASVVWFALGLLEAIPFFCLGGGLVHIGILSVGLGAVVLTRFGRQDYLGSGAVLSLGPPALRSAAEKQPDAPRSTGSGPSSPAPPDVSAAEQSEEPRFETPPLESAGPFPEE